MAFKNMKYLAILLCLFTSCLLEARPKVHYREWAKQQTDLVVFSFNRPLQLYAFLESVERHVEHLANIHVIYRSTDSRFENGYQTVFSRFPFVRAHKQGKKAPKDFKPLVQKCVYNKQSPCPYIMFAVDDIIITDHIDISECVKALEKYKCWFFSLRLGKNITDTVINPVVSLNRLPGGQPAGKDVGKDFFRWSFDDPSAQGSWNYPNSVDLHIYRKKELRRVLKKAKYHNPNMLEAEWHWHYPPKRNTGVSYRHSKAINIPLNVVNPFWNSANLNISAWTLLDKFLEGYKIDIDKFRSISNSATHMDYEVSYIKREALVPDSQ